MVDSSLFGKYHNKNWVKVLHLYLNRNNMIGHFSEIKPVKNQVNLYDYHPELLDYGKDSRWNDSRYNLGDSLGFPIVDYMLKRKGLNINDHTKRIYFLNTVGSNLFVSFQNSTVWGSGLLHEHWGGKKSFLLRYPFLKLDVRAVRGPLTRNVLLKFNQRCPEVYGDPAILMPLIYQPPIHKKREILVIPQFVTEKQFRIDHPTYDVLSMNTNDYRYVIDEIASSQLVIASSLHAVILADAYGVPSVLYRGLGKEIDFKYYDYYYSTDRYNVMIADSFEDALKVEPLSLPNLSELQQGLIDSFPYDLWNND